MKTDLFIFTKAPTAYEPNRYLEVARNLGLNSEIVAYSDLDFNIHDDGVEVTWQGKALPLSKMAIFRAAGGDNFYIPQRDYLVDWFTKNGCVVLNERTYKRWPRLDKITQHLILSQAGLPIISSKVYGLNDRVYESEKNFPFIMKKNLSSRGRDVFKIKTKSGLTRMFNKEYFARTMLLQPFLVSGQDLRIIVLNGKALGCMKRIARAGKYLTNYSQGGMIENYDLEEDPVAREIAEKTAKLFDLDYVGVDLMQDEKGAWRVLEVNRACQFKGFETATGINVPEKVIRYLTSRS